MKLDQLFIWILVAFVVIMLGKIIAETYDEIEIVYDPVTGRQGFKAHKNQSLDGATPLVLEGK
jgi:hypothetical protein